MEKLNELKVLVLKHKKQVIIGLSVLLVAVSSFVIVGSASNQAKNEKEEIKVVSNTGVKMKEKKTPVEKKKVEVEAEKKKKAESEKAAKAKVESETKAKVEAESIAKAESESAAQVQSEVEQQVAVAETPTQQVVEQPIQESQYVAPDPVAQAPSNPVTPQAPAPSAPVQPQQPSTPAPPAPKPEQPQQPTGPPAGWMSPPYPIGSGELMDWLMDNGYFGYDAAGAYIRPY